MSQFDRYGCRDNTGEPEQTSAKTVALGRYGSCSEMGYAGACCASYDIAKHVNKQLRKHKRNPEEFAKWAKEFFTLPRRREYEKYWL